MASVRKSLTLCLFLLAASLPVGAEPQYTYAGQPISKIVYQGLNLADEAMPLIDAENYKAALSKLEKANQMAPGYPHILSNLAYAYIRLGQAAKGLPFIKQATELSPAESSMIQNLAMAYVSVGRPQDAVAAVEKFLAQHNGHPETDKMTSYLKSLHEEVKRQSKAQSVEGVNSTDSYFAYAGAESGLTRWDFGRLPLKVYLAPPHAVRGWSPDLTAELKDSFAVWAKASEGKIQFQYVEAKEGADITVTFTQHVSDLRSPDEGGEARVKYGTRGIMHSDIFILTYDEKKDKIKDRNEIRGICLHEVGHSLGLMGHSPNAEDVMYFSDTGSAVKPQLSTRDIKTLAMLYETKTAFIPNKGSEEERELNKIGFFNDAVDDFNSQHYPETITKCRKALGLDDHFDDAKRLMADALDNLAVDLMEKDNYPEAEKHLKLAIDVRRTLGQTKDLGLSLSNYAILLRNTNRQAEAQKVEMEAKKL